MTRTTYAAAMRDAAYAALRVADLTRCPERRRLACLVATSLGDLAAYVDVARSVQARQDAHQYLNRAESRPNHDHA